MMNSDKNNTLLFSLAMATPLNSLLQTMNQLQDVFTTVGVSSDAIQLPQIVVVGSQSSGKSSVLENIVGRDFLPRGMGIVTRRPLVLQLVHTDHQFSANGVEHMVWSEFLHRKGEMFTDFQQLKQEIVVDTERVAGNTKGISSLPIRLKIFSNSLPNLTLVDLPGLTKVPVGDQPEDIESQIERLVLEYVENENSIILAISSGNQDIATSDAMKIAKKADPFGERTLAVITKVDLMEKAVETINLLKGVTLPVKLGIIGVVNRSQIDIEKGKNIKDALEFEDSFFRKHHPTLSSKMGTKFLSQTLSSILMGHVKKCLPSLRSKISHLKGVQESVIVHLGHPVSKPGPEILSQLSSFCEELRGIINGNSANIQSTEINGGAKLFYIFQDAFSKALEDFDPMTGLTLSDLRHTIRNSMGTKPSLFVPEIAFEVLAKRQIGLLRDLCLRVVDLSYDELANTISVVCCRHFERFDNLKDEVIKASINLLTENLSPTREMVQNLLAIEQTYINTNHPDFIFRYRMVSERYRGNPSPTDSTDDFSAATSRTRISICDKRGAYNFFLFLLFTQCF